MRYKPELIKAAQALYLKRYTPKEIAKSLHLKNVRIVYYWAEKYKWALLLSEESIEDAINRRLALLIGRDDKTELELKEIDNLVIQHVKIAKARSNARPELSPVSGGASEAVTGQPNLQQLNEKPGKKPRRNRKNDISEITAAELEEVAKTLLYPHQLYVRDHKNASRYRFILKSRQIGFTFYFAFEAFEDAILTGNNQIFVSSSKAQARVFSMYIKRIADEFFNVEIKGGDIITLSNHANLILCANNVSTAQSYSGNVYFDEVFWMSKFIDLYTGAKAMATLGDFKITLFSTPSTKDHPCYKLWSGEEWKDGSPKRKYIDFPKDESLRMNGTVCPDKFWRLLITMEDAIKLGFDKVDIDDLRESNSAQAFKILYCCKFAATGKGVFNFEKLQKCITDATKWQDLDLNAARPFGNREVWAGFDPSRTRDNATFALVAPPLHPDEKFRVIAIYQWRGMNFKYMANEIKKIKEKFNITYIGIDITGIGYGVYEHIREFARREVRDIHYNVNIKNQLVLKMVDVVEEGRIEWDEEQKTLITAFMSIEQQTTAKSNQITYAASRTETTGHADEFFAISHAVFNEPLNNTKKRKSTWILPK